MKICLVGAELFHGIDKPAAGQTERNDVANIRFSQFANAPKPAGLNWHEVVPNTMHWRVFADSLTKVRVG
jgi:hypothetical protein